MHTAFGPQDDMSYVGSAATLGEAWQVLETTLAGAGVVCCAATTAVCGHVALNTMKTRNCQRPSGTCALEYRDGDFGVELLGSAAKALHPVHVCWGRAMAVPSQTATWEEPALATLQA